jgi:hypothetical protein
MGAGQSKQQLPQPTSSLSAVKSETSQDSSIKNAKEESGGCPMKNAVVAAAPEKRIDPSTSARPATTAEIDQRSIPAWFVSFSAG